MSSCSFSTWEGTLGDRWHLPSWISKHMFRSTSWTVVTSDTLPTERWLLKNEANIDSLKAAVPQITTRVLPLTWVAGRDFQCPSFMVAMRWKWSAVCEHFRKMHFIWIFYPLYLDIKQPFPLQLQAVSHSVHTAICRHSVYCSTEWASGWDHFLTDFSQSFGARSILDHKTCTHM